jgi:hypothetical protein
MTKRTFVNSHTYRGIDQRMRSCIIPAIIELFIAVAFLAICIDLLKLAVATGVTATLESMDLNLLWGLPLTFILLVFFPAFMATRYPNIDVYEEGLEIQLFWIFRLFVPWEDVLALRTKIGVSKRIRVVVVRKLTPFHRLMGTSLHGKRRPTFAILPSIDRYHELIRTIKEKANLEDD